MSAPASVVVGTNPADTSGQTIRFTTTGAPGPIMWRFGDLTDHEQMDPAQYQDHTYSGEGPYEAIGHIGPSGQRMVVDVTITPAPPDPPADPTVISCAPATIHELNVTEITVTGTGFAAGLDMVTIAEDVDVPLVNLNNVVVVNDTTFTGETTAGTNADVSPLFIGVWREGMADEVWSATAILAVERP